MNHKWTKERHFPFGGHVSRQNTTSQSDRPRPAPKLPFSGTNDSRHLLPLHVTQLDLQEQKHTNALVLEHLLQPINSIELISPAAKKVTDAEHLLSTVVNLEPPVQVILDVGAQILELDNLGVAKEWLKKSSPEKEAVVFVNDTDDLCVVDRRGRIDLLQVSPFGSRLGACLVFLDESHTRGIDLKLPTEYRAAVTLGAHLTKDRLMQACMRMRKLGKGQSVVFCISQEIQTKILETTSHHDPRDITLKDVLLWSISETHAETRRSMPLWTVQGERFVKQEKIWQDMKSDGKTVLSKNGAETLLEQEAQSIDHRYRPRKTDNQPLQLRDQTDPDLQRIVERCHEFDKLQFNTSTLQEEQERELSPEIEQERQVQKAPPAKPATHNLHDDVVEFAVHGTIRSKSLAYAPAFESLKRTTASSEVSLPQLNGGNNLLATTDFSTTIQATGVASMSDSFQRHVQWVLTRCANDTVDLIMIISEYEANLLLPRMQSRRIMLHKYKARSNAAYDPLDHLQLFTMSGNTTPPRVPRPLSIQLGLFAGQLYITSHEDYLEICKFLGLSATLLTGDMEKQGWKVGSDGFVLRDGHGRVGGSSGLTKSPINFFKILMSKIRRNGDGIAKTDMGSLLDGKLFDAADWKEE